MTGVAQPRARCIRPYTREAVLGANLKNMLAPFTLPSRHFILSQLLEKSAEHPASIDIAPFSTLR
jgi:hypothetical protein